MPSKKLFGVPLDRQSLGEMIRFSIVGVLVTAIHYAVYWLLQLVIDVNISWTAGYIAGFVFNCVQLLHECLLHLSF